MVAGVHAAACQSLDWRIVAVASRSMDRAADLAASVHSNAATFDDLLEQQRADIAIVATPRRARRRGDRTARRGISRRRRGTAACTLADADRLIESEERLGRPVLYSEHLASAPTVDACSSASGESAC